jgi:hypothetical protein
MEVPNINHFPTQGASGGAISILNVDFIEDVNFYTGGFSAVYGDKLSSIMDISFREGNRQKFNMQLDLNFAGFGGVAEGPISKNGSWLFSARRSYLDYLVRTVNVGSTMAPSYGDYQGKVVYDLSPSHQLTFLGIAADEQNSPDRETAIENDMVFFGNQDNNQFMTGLNWRVLWEDIGYSNTSLTYNSTNFTEDFFETGSGKQITRNRSLEQALTFRNVNHLVLSPNLSAEVGFEGKLLTAEFEIFFNEYSDAFGNPVPAVHIDRQIHTEKMAAFTSLIVRPIPCLRTSIGLRTDYFAYNSINQISPRFSLSYQVTERFKVNGATGIFYQNLPLILLSSFQGTGQVKDLKSIHYILGLQFPGDRAGEGFKIYPLYSGF